MLKSLFISLLTGKFYQSRELSVLSTAPFSPSFLNKFNDTSGLDHFSGPLLGPLGHVGLK